MTNTENELKQCSKCHSTILLKYFEVNRKGELFKTCNHCRKVKQTYRDLHKQDFAICQCGATIQARDKTRHERSNKHLSYLDVADELKSYEHSNQTVDPKVGKEYIMPNDELGYISFVELSGDQMDELMRKGYKCILGISESGKKTMVPKGWMPV